MKKNPFAVLGLSHDIVGELPNADLKNLVRRQRNTLQSLFHADVSVIGSSTRSTEINLAFESLQDPDNFLRFKALFLKRISYKKQAEELSVTVGKLELKLAQVGVDYQSVVMQYLLAMRPNASLNVLNARSLRLELFDFCKAMDPNSGKWTGETMHSANTLKLSNSLQIDSQGNISKSVAGRPYERKPKILIGTISEALVFSEPYNGRFENVMELNQQIIKDHNGRFVLLENQSSGEIFRGRIPLNTFQRLLPLLTPNIEKGGYLFSLNEYDGEYSAFLDGRINRIDNLHGEKTE